MSGTALATGGIVAVARSADWTAAEKEQIRSALGVDGDKTSVTDSEIIDDISTHDENIIGLIMSG